MSPLAIVDNTTANPGFTDNTIKNPSESLREVVSIDVLYLVVAAFFVVINIAGNIILIVCIAKYRWMHTITNMIILSLGISDLLTGAVAIPMVTMMWTGLLEGVASSSLCKAVYGVTPILTFVTLGHLMLVNCDRYIAISRPLSYNTVITGKRVCFMIIGIWVAGILPQVI
jgi:G protein-coupled receptor 21